MKQTVVLFPGLGMGHLTPMVELAKLFVDSGFSATIVIVEPPFDPTSAIGPFISRVSAAHPSISFHRLPKIPFPPGPNPFTSVLGLLRLSTSHLSEFLKLLSQTADIRALVLDFFCTDALDVSAELGIPSYFFFATSASNLATFLLLPALKRQAAASLKDRGDELIHIPGVQPIPASHMPGPLQDRKDELYHTFMHHLERLPKADGIMINTFELLEKRAVQALDAGLCAPAGEKMPPIYCVGPLVGNGSSGSGAEEKHECLKWLDAQPKGSVVFLCFGSMGSFSADQLREIAVGLERSGQRFLWAVRSTPSTDPNKRFGPRPEPDLRVLMPEGFLERTEGRGMVVKSWAPQAAVLAHGSVGGFVTHCGWNSILEAVRAGVPMIAWPLYAEQRMNKVFLVEEAKLAEAMEGYDKELVSAEEVETKIRWLMESEGGREMMKEGAAATKEKAIAAWRDSGSSATAWMQLATVLKKGITECNN